MIDVNEIRSAAIALHGLTGCDFRIRFITTIGTEQPELLAAKAPFRQRSEQVWTSSRYFWTARRIKTLRSPITD